MLGIYPPSFDSRKRHKVSLVYRSRTWQMLDPLMGWGMLPMTRSCQHNWFSVITPLAIGQEGAIPIDYLSCLSRLLHLSVNLDISGTRQGSGRAVRAGNHDQISGQICRRKHPLEGWNLSLVCLNFFIACIYFEIEFHYIALFGLKLTLQPECWFKGVRDGTRASCMLGKPSAC